MGESCSTHGEDKKPIQNSGRKNLKGQDHLEDLRVEIRITSEWIPQKQVGKVWSGFTSTGGGGPFLKTVMNFRVP